MDRAHLTLRFFGELPTPTPELQASIQAELDACPPLALSLGAPGIFGGRSPQVLWVGVAGPGAPELQALGAALARAAGLGPPERRPFRPHLTLARVRRRRRVERGVLSRALEAVAIRPLAFQASQAVLFSSNAGSGAPLHHQVLGRLRLGASESPRPLEQAAARPSPGRDELSQHLAAYLAGAAAKPPPSRAAHLSLARAARAALEHALPWPPEPERVEELLADRSARAQARARRRLAERAPLEERRVRQGLEDARRRVEDLLEEAEEDPAGAEQSALREAAAWVARHGLPGEWFAGEATRVGLKQLPESGEHPARPAPTLREIPTANPEDAPYLAAAAEAWEEDALFLLQRAPGPSSEADRIVELQLARAPSAAELAHFARALAEQLERPARVLGCRSLGRGRRRLRLAWREPEAAPALAGPEPSEVGPAEAERQELLERLGGREPERYARRDYLLGVSPSGDPLLLRALIDRGGRSDLACWAGPWEGRTRVVLFLGERALERGLSAGVLLRRTLGELGGAGGGSPRLAEGACPAEPDQVLAAFRRWVLAGGLA